MDKFKDQTPKRVAKYFSDLEEVVHSLPSEVTWNNYNIEISSASKINDFLHSRDLCNIYPGIDIALSIYLSVPATNCSGERSFSILKRVKNYLRAGVKKDNGPMHLHY
ncbi:hypothetical protein TNIN_228121 [Trichonephila inaurata madagascariensis]|uniref:HAT C-terminal dimerisation domain-containing protein n=1 Tax=Trichonephila inaurata madagascariensis TaxID=2747483 RepID=A0A8X6MDW0_9ARAC|nr:hypothetical protein TNIN_228121 [Trichonephila inaurata madagascariensis]